MIYRVTVPMLNANEELVQAVRVRVRVGELVRGGQVLIDVETEKAAAEVEAPAEGYVRQILIAEGEKRNVGDLLCVLTSSADEPVETKAAPVTKADGESQNITRKARELAEQRGIDWRKIQKSGIITERDIAGLSSPQMPVQAAERASKGRMPIVILGAAGGGKVLVELISHVPALKVVGYLDPQIAKGSVVAGFPVLGGDDELETLLKSGPHLAVVACGLIHFNPKIRIGAFDRCRRLGVKMPPLVHPRAFVDPSATLGEAVQVHAMAVVGADAVLGDGVVVNTSAVVSHDCQVGDHTHISPGALVAGHVRIGARCVIGMGVTLLNQLTVGDDVIINNGKHVMNHVGSGTHVK